MVSFLYLENFVVKDELLLLLVKLCFSLPFHTRQLKSVLYFLRISADVKIKPVIEAVSVLPAMGITDKAWFFGALRKGICNFPPLVCTAVFSFYQSYFLFFIPSRFFSFSSHCLRAICVDLMSPFSYSIHLLFCTARGLVVYLKLAVQKTLITVCFCYFKTSKPVWLSVQIGLALLQVKVMIMWQQINLLAISPPPDIRHPEELSLLRKPRDPKKKKKKLDEMEEADIELEGPLLTPGSGELHLQLVAE